MPRSSQADRELLDDHEPFTSAAKAQAAIDAFAARYNADRPHQSLDEQAPVSRAERFTPVDAGQRDLLKLWLPPALAPASTEHDTNHPTQHQTEPDQPAATDSPPAQSWAGGPVEFDRVVPPSGNMTVAGKQFWLGTARAGVVVRFWADS